MDPTDFLRHLGGVSEARPLVAVCGRQAVVGAVRSGAVLRTGRGRYALPEVEVGLRRAHGLSAVLSHESAAAWWGWELAEPPVVPTVTVPRDRKARGGRAARISYRDLPSSDVVDPGVTSPVRTVLDCATTLSFGAALAVADSAVRHGSVTREELVLTASASPGRGRQRRLRVARLADGRAANPFESVLRALAIEAGLVVEPQVSLWSGRRVVRPDLLDARRGLALEAESFTWHGDRARLERDCEKYNDLSLLGLVVLRFSWEDVMLRPLEVLAVLGRARTGVGRWTGVPDARPEHLRRSA